MKSFGLRSVARMLALACAPLLAACGGGGEDTQLVPASAPMLASFEAIADYCGVQPGTPRAPDGPLLDTFGSARVSRYGAQFGQAAAARTGWTPFDAHDRQSLGTELRDLRSASGRYVGKGGLALPGVRMGVEFPSQFPAAGIVCVAPVSWLKPLADDPVYKTLVWESRERSPLPVDALQATPVDGFELLANFAIAEGQVFFVALKTMVADPQAVQVCHLGVGASGWACTRPQVLDRGDRWQFTQPGAAAGAWLLASTHAEAGR